MTDIVNLTRFNETVRRIPRNSKILDVGFGYAELPFLLRDCVWSGFEADKKLVKLALNKNLNASYGDVNLKWTQKPEDFDVVVLMNVLEHVDSPLFALREAKRVLRKGGRVIATIPYGLNLKKLWFERVDLKIINRSFNEETQNGFFKPDICCFGRNEAAYLFLSAGFKQIKINRICGFIPKTRIQVDWLKVLSNHLLVEAIKD
jgi:SAM-dependent methyltransferase